MNTAELNIIKWKNRLQTLLLFALMGLFVWILGRWILGDAFALYALVLVTIMMIFNPAFSPRLLMKAYQARKIEVYEAPALHQAIRQLTKRAHLPEVPTLYYLPVGTMTAFATGTQKNAVIALSDGLLRNLTLDEIIGVLAHEISHIRHKDMLIMSMADMIGQLTRILSLTGQLFLIFSLPVLLVGALEINMLPFMVIILAPFFSALIQLAISRKREIMADMSAAQLIGSPEPLINALIKLERQSSYWERYYRASSDNALLRTHPTTAQRIEQLETLQNKPVWEPMERPQSWHYPWPQQPYIQPRRVSRYLWF